MWDPHSFITWLDAEAGLLLTGLGQACFLDQSSLICELARGCTQTVRLGGGQALLRLAHGAKNQATCPQQTTHGKGCNATQPR